MNEADCFTSEEKLTYRQMLKDNSQYLGINILNLMEVEGNAMNNGYMEDNEILKEVAGKLDTSVIIELFSSFFEDPVCLYTKDDVIDNYIVLQSDCYQRMAEGEFSDVDQYLAELCVHIKDDNLRETLISAFDLDREYIKTELLYNQ